ncbi:MAG: [FeFe] hydrogenase H-cluster maturation GTPase HydF [Lachnospiraceae bacterium]|jgi:[FeFe] hydrogenase H-cluster maturation GTPase HydF|nr:[FeFe] hydrogenase H-cluster maturation GTPase HydF [Lachnospiraceae bacterium]MCI9399808.1 [FeFe] hydrogenase H-cluster maturation GTPase HydF [Lachnospiraceae bacterium]MCX4375627.1 [FeFe] hydrogenase H-cluster maturation GTPase HydF [Lachnospiraceae bacterium]
MAETGNEIPASNRLHIGVFGRTNSGKSSFINAFTGQQVSIVADVAGTTTDPVYKPMEIAPLGACVLIDTAGFDDNSPLGGSRMEKTMLAAEKSDIAVIIFAENKMEQELAWYSKFQERNTPVLLLVGKADSRKPEETQALLEQIKKKTGKEALPISTVTGVGRDKVREALARLIPEDFGTRFITGDLLEGGESVMLVMPQDIQAPKGRLILPQVQTIRELLDRKCIVTSVTTDQFTEGLVTLQKPPKLIITDSQAFGYVYQNKPAESMLTSFSVLFAAYKGDLPYYMEGARHIENLNAHSKVLIAECCTHAPLAEDIGRVKLPRMLRKRFGETLQTEVKSGTDFPQDLTEYDLIIQCGACMFNRNYVLSRIDRARKQNVPMTNYGVAIAHLTGILDQIVV